MSKVTVKTFHNDEEVASVDMEGVATIGVYGAQGSAQYVVKESDHLVTIRFTGDFNPETGNSVDVESKKTPAQKATPPAPAEEK